MNAATDTFTTTTPTPPPSSSNTGFHMPTTAHMTHTATLPSSILHHRSVARTLTFASTRSISHLRVTQRVLVYGQAVEEWAAEFGFVIPESVNEWSHIVEAAGEEEMVDAEVVSGNTVIETVFYDKDEVLSTLTVTVFYDNDAGKNPT
ncbi:hypothetical protein PhCBS80983_g03368 [Powellomyces hirtus]|uniref:GMP phosphodiesterase delta subunit domain-containing protein n=1 Tax=Powellomyces hirtus TaxID=109895 RepID=A0A507E2Q4_9FUNG|nr:hypothetical protein PhCBS80983_g03368 [Powellomyces hirtus]